MGYHTIVEYLGQLSKLYYGADKKRKSQLLDDAEKITNRHRKSLIRTLSRNCQSEAFKKAKSGRRRVYPEELLLPHIKYLWNCMERISARRMKAAFSDWLFFYTENNVDNKIKGLLQAMSISTLDRFLSKLRKLEKRSLKGIATTSPASFMKNKVPINTLDATVIRPGHIQVDTVAHCGESASGPFISSLTFTDIYSTWTENRALFTKNSKEVAPCLERIQRDLPFRIYAVNTDSGSEFLNMRVFNQFKKKNIHFTRSRAYRKNDNCFVEQKNFTHVRELFGYQRFEEEDLKLLMNEIYKDWWNPLMNYFIPTFKLKKKIRVGARIKKIYDKPLTPYKRLMNSKDLSEAQKTLLAQKRRSVNPFELKKGLEQKLACFFKQVVEYNKLKQANMTEEDE